MSDTSILWHGGTVGSVAATQLQGPCINSELGLLSVGFSCFPVSAWVSSGLSSYLQKMCVCVCVCNDMVPYDGQAYSHLITSVPGSRQDPDLL